MTKANKTVLCDNWRHLETDIIVVNATRPKTDATKTLMNPLLK